VVLVFELRALHLSHTWFFKVIFPYNVPCFCSGPALSSDPSICSFTHNWDNRNTPLPLSVCSNGVLPTFCPGVFELQFSRSLPPEYLRLQAWATMPSLLAHSLYFPQQSTGPRKIFSHYAGWVYSQLLLRHLT
jgi:hypothetical protein